MKVSLHVRFYLFGERGLEILNDLLIYSRRTMDFNPS